MKKLELLWSDEFDAAAGSSVNEDFWNFDIGDGTAAGIPGWGNQEHEWYRPEQAQHDGRGNLVITAELADPATAPLAYYGKPAEWYSSKLTTKGKVEVQYGLITARVKVPTGAGSWPAFWMLGAGLSKGEVWPDCGEIDIVEAKGSQPYTAFGTLHGPGYNGQAGTQRGSAFLSPGPALSNDYHVYAIDWKPNQIDFSVDGKVYFTHSAADVAPNKWVFNQEFFLILNLATGGNFEPEIDPMLQSASMSIDYIRYYSVNGQGKLYRR